MCSKFGIVIDNNFKKKDTVFRLPHLADIPRLIYCAPNSIFGAIALRYNFEYGCQMPTALPSFPLFFADQDWKEPDRTGYMRALAKYKPNVATVLDLERPDQFDEVMSWAAEAAQYVRETVIVIPKFQGSVEMIPETINGKKIVLGYSVPTSFGGTSLPITAFGRRPVHLLGGRPQKQMSLAGRCNTVSADANMMSRMANEINAFFCGGFAPHSKSYFAVLGEVGYAERVDANLLAFEISCMNVYNAWHFPSPCFLRFAHEGDLTAFEALDRYAPRVVDIPREHLLKHIGNRHVYVAQQHKNIIGYCIAPRQPSGFTEILHIAVHPAHRKMYVGSALLSAITHTARACVPLLDEALNALFETRGWEAVAQTDSKRLWERKVFFGDARRIAEIDLRAHYDKATRCSFDSASYLLLPPAVLERLQQDVKGYKDD